MHKAVVLHACLSAIWQVTVTLNPRNLLGCLQLNGAISYTFQPTKRFNLLSCLNLDIDQARGPRILAKKNDRRDPNRLFPILHAKLADLVISTWRKIFLYVSSLILARVMSDDRNDLSCPFLMHAGLNSRKNVSSCSRSGVSSVSLV